MRETNINNPIDRNDVKVGDKIRVSREVVVTGVRETQIYDRAKGKHKNITVVSTSTETLALSETDAVTLLEREKTSEIKIPTSATHVFWQDEDGYDYYARRDAVSEEWVTSEGPDDTYTTAALIEEIENPAGEFDIYKPNTFQVLKHKYANGGVIGQQFGTPIQVSVDAAASLSRQIQDSSLRNRLLGRA